MASAQTVALPSLRLAPGAVIADRFEVLAMLGQGGMGAVYRVRDIELDEEVALKVLKPEIAESVGALERFRREVKLARRVTHPNVARTFDLGNFEGVRYLTMELICGEALSQRAGQGRRLPLPEALRIAAEIARGLGAAHAVGVVHRDLKPDNVMCVEQRVVITDFGIARLADTAIGSSQTVGVAIGTPAYMAPEQLEGRELDGRADIYALGIVIYELLTGELPFKGDTIYALAAARLSGPIPDVRAVLPDVPAEVAELVHGALARKREDRPDAQGLLARLDAMRGGAQPVDRMNTMLAIPSSTSFVTPQGPRVLAIAPISATGDTVQLAADLTGALADSIATVRALRVLSPGSVATHVAQHVHEGALDAVSLGRALHADLVFDGSLRVAGGRARVRARLIDVQSGVQQWADRVEGATDDPFALEDLLVRTVSEPLRQRFADGATQKGPSDPTARELYTKARALYKRFGPQYVREAVDVLEEANTKFPHDAYVMSALGAALTRLWVVSGARDRDLIARAEEHSLRALSADPSIGETFVTIGILRLNQGETQAAARAFKEAVARSPLLAEAHEYLGRLLCETGHVEEGLRRLDLAIRLDPKQLPSHWERARTLALTGEREQADEAMKRAIAAAGDPGSGLFNRARFAFWFSDRETARLLADDLEKTIAEGPAPIATVLAPIMRAFEQNRPLDEALTAFRAFSTLPSASSRQQAFFLQLATELKCITGDLEQALQSTERAAELGLVDVLWLDHCPLLAAIRDDPRFARARASTAERAARVWS